MDNPLCNCTPNPPAEWVKGVCVKCWHWKHTPSFRKDLNRKRLNLPSVAANRGTGEREIPPGTVCAHRGAQLTGPEREEHALGHNRTYYRCSAGETRNRQGVTGVVCPCSGCGPRCPKFSLGEDQ